MDEDNQRSFNMPALGSRATGAGDSGRDRGGALAVADTLARFESLGSDEQSPSNGQLWKGINALIEAMKSALEGDGVSARYFIGSASASLAHTGSEGDTPVATSETIAVRCCGGLAPWQVRRLKTHMEENLGDTIYCEDLARLVRLSVSHFMRAFKESFGCAPHAFLIRRRVERAQGFDADDGRGAGTDRPGVRTGRSVASDPPVSEMGRGKPCGMAPGANECARGAVSACGSYRPGLAGTFLNSYSAGNPAVRT